VSVVFLSVFFGRVLVFFGGNACLSVRRATAGFGDVRLARLQPGLTLFEKL
jgi:hypothetical protein